MFRKLFILLIAVFFAFLNFAIWKNFHKPLTLRPQSAIINGVSFNPLGKHQTPQNQLDLNEQDIEKNIAHLKGRTLSLRTYSMDGNSRKIPEIAARNSMNVILGAWIGNDLKANRKEIEALVEASNKDNPNITGILVGNEVILRRDISEKELIEYIREVKVRTNRPVSTAEIWDRWLMQPAVAAEVDFIAVHLLPFWEGVSIDKAVDLAFDCYYKIQKQYTNKPIIVTEVGWPSEGNPFKQAIASPENQAKFIRDFSNRAEVEGIKYYVIEAFDQPWKNSEGTVGSYWGIFDAERNLRYPINQTILNNKTWEAWAIASILFGLGIIFLSITSGNVKVFEAVFLGIIANFSAMSVCWFLYLVSQTYQTYSSIMLFGILTIMQLVALVVLTFKSKALLFIWHHKTVIHNSYLKRVSHGLEMFVSVTILIFSLLLIGNPSHTFLPIKSFFAFLLPVVGLGSFTIIRNLCFIKKLCGFTKKVTQSSFANKMLMLAKQEILFSLLFIILIWIVWNHEHFDNIFAKVWIFLLCFQVLIHITTLATILLNYLLSVKRNV